MTFERFCQLIPFWNNASGVYKESKSYDAMIEYLIGESSNGKMTTNEAYGIAEDIEEEFKGRI